MGALAGARTCGAHHSSGMSVRSAPRWKIISSPQLLKDLTRSGTGTRLLWGKFLPGDAVALIVGEASAGKTIFLHRLARSLARGATFLGLTTPKRLRILHVDVESPRVAPALANSNAS